MGGVLSLAGIMSVVEEAMKRGKVPADSFDERRNELEKLSDCERDMKLLSTEGSEEAREYTRNRVNFILGELHEHIREDNIDSLISSYHVDYHKNPFSGGDAANLEKPVDRDIEANFCRYVVNPGAGFEKKLAKLAQIVYQELYGYGILDELIFESEFNEVACNRSDYIWIQYRGIKRRIPNPGFKFPDEESYCKMVENRLVSTAKHEMNAGDPLIQAVLRNGFRVTALRPPLSRYFTVNVRLFIYKQISSEACNRFMNEKMRRLVELLAAKGRRNIAIIGEQGSGKTTAADELVIKNLDDDLSIGLAESIHELAVSVKYPGKNVVELQYAGKFSPSDITEMFFRLNRDIVIYGEVRSAAEAFEMIKAMLRQARGSLFTFHSSGVRRMVHDLRQLLMQTGCYTDYREAQFDVADAVDLVIQIKLDRATGLRYVHRISEIAADEDSMGFEVNDLFIYDRDSGKYLVNRNGLCKSSVESCLEYEMNLHDITALRDMFTIKPGEEDHFGYI